MLDKEEVRYLYLKGFNAVEIAKKLRANIEAVRKCIQRNLSHLKKQHEMALTQRKEEIKAVNSQSKNYISDKSFILKNRSIYETLPNGDIVLKKEARKIVTWDTPRRLVNENKCII
jgi:hypothetical protein